MQEYAKEDTIFVQIASYRDPELQWTLKDLFEKAKRINNNKIVKACFYEKN